MQRTSLGLTQVEPGESIFEDRASFTVRNIDLIDRLLRLGASTHSHTGKPAVADPTTAPTMAVDAAGGTIPADTPVYAGFTALDDRGGETLLSPVDDGVTPGGISDVPDAPTAVADYTAGTLPPNTYYYVLTGTDATGGETQAGAVATAVVLPGNVNARVLLDGLLTAVQAIGAVGWRLYRSTNGGQLGLLGQGATETFTDDGQPCLDAQLQPPVDSTTGGTAALRITVPLAALPADATGFRLYVSTTADFSGANLLVGEYGLAGADVEIAVPSLELQSGYPPPVSTSLEEPGGGGGGGALTTMIESVGDQVIPAAGTGSLDVVLNQPLPGEKQRVDVGVWLDHDDPSDLTITLIDPDGAEYGLTWGGGNQLDPALNYGVPASIGTAADDDSMGWFGDWGDPRTDGGGPWFVYQASENGFFTSQDRLSARLIGDDTGASVQGNWTVRFTSGTGAGVLHRVAIKFGALPHRRDGHIISDDGTQLPPRAELGFVGFTVEDDLMAGRTTVRSGYLTRWGMYGSYLWPGAPQQNVQLDATYGIMATAAAADARLLADVPPSSSFGDQRVRAHFNGVAADDVVGIMVKALAINDFLAVRLDNTVPALEIVSVDLGVETVLASLPLAAAVLGELWLSGEIVWEALGVTLHTMNPNLSIAAPVESLGVSLDATQLTKWQDAAAPGVGGIWIVAGAGNTALLLDANGATP